MIVEKVVSLQKFMQMKKVILLLFLLIPMLDIFYSCCHCDVETEHVSYSHQTLQLKNLDNSGEINMENYVANMRYSYESEKPNAFSIEGSIGKLIVDLLLMTAPTSDNLQQFKIQIVLSDGRILEELTSEIELI